MIIVFGLFVGLCVGTFAGRVVGPSVRRAAFRWVSIGGALTGGILLGLVAGQGLSLGPAGLLGALGGALLAPLLIPTWASAANRPKPSDPSSVLP